MFVVSVKDNSVVDFLAKLLPENKWLHSQHTIAYDPANEILQIYHKQLGRIENVDV